MTCSETVPEDIDCPLPSEAIEPGSLEWFRAHAPLSLVLRAFFEDEQNRANFCESVVESDTMIVNAEMLAELLELYPDDPNAKEIAARIRLTA